MRAYLHFFPHGRKLALQVHFASQCFELLSSYCLLFSPTINTVQIKCTMSTEKADPTASPRVRKKDMTTPVGSASSRGTTLGP